MWWLLEVQQPVDAGRCLQCRCRPAGRERQRYRADNWLLPAGLSPPITQLRFPSPLIVLVLSALGSNLRPLCSLS